MTRKAEYLTAELIEKWKEQFLHDKIRRQPFSISDSALLVVDMQNYFLDEKSHAFIPAGRTALPNIQNLISKFRDTNRPIIFTYFGVKDNEPDPIERWWGESIKNGSRESRIISELEPRKDDLIIRKPTYSSFNDTVLETFLQANNAKNLVISGVMANLCCEMAAREAFVRDFNVFFVMDATATQNEELHEATIKNLSHGFATPMLTMDFDISR